MLRPNGCALLFSKVRLPRLPMLDEPPLEEPPARASAIAGANARLALRNNARRMRQFIDRRDIARPLEFLHQCRAYGVPSYQRKHPAPENRRWQSLPLQGAGGQAAPHRLAPAPPTVAWRRRLLDSRRTAT